VIPLENNEDPIGYYLRLSGIYPARECPECPKLQHMGVYLAPDPEESGYICPACKGFYRLEKREGKKETLRKIGTATIERMEW